MRREEARLSSTLLLLCAIRYATETNEFDSDFTELNLNGGEHLREDDLQSATVWTVTLGRAVADFRLLHGHVDRRRHGRL